MQTIETRYLPASMHRPARMVAIASGGGPRSRVVLSASDIEGATHDSAHVAAARALMVRKGWAGKMIGGHTKRGMVFVFDSVNSPSFRQLERWTR